MRHKAASTLSALALLALLAAPAAANADSVNSDPAPTATADPGSQIVQGAAASDSTAPPSSSDLPPATIEHLRDRGLTGDITLVQEQGGMVGYGDDEGGWVIEDLPAVPPKGATTNVTTYTGCEGNFAPTRKVIGWVEFGAQDNCFSTSGTVYPHVVSSRLEDTCATGICIVWQQHLTVSSSTPFNALVTASGAMHCAATGSGDTRTYRSVANVTVKGYQFGPFYQSGVVIQNCDVQPG